MSEATLSYKDRVLAMLTEGKISQEEANQLLEALDDASEVEASMQAVASEIRETARSVQNETAKPVVQEETTSRDRGQEGTKEAFRRTDLSWVVIEMLAGDIDIRLDASLSEPVVSKGKAYFDKAGSIYMLKRNKAKQDSSGDYLKEIGNMVASLLNGLHGDLKLLIPPGFGVEIHSKAGDVDVQGAAFLKAHLLAGDLDAKDIGGIELHMAAGDVDVSLNIQEGQHSINLTAGDVDIELLPGSSLKLEGSVSMGDFKLTAPKTIENSLKINNTLMGGDFSAVIGDGEASLSIDLSTGDLDVKVIDA